MAAVDLADRVGLADDLVDQVPPERVRQVLLHLEEILHARHSHLAMHLAQSLDGHTPPFLLHFVLLPWHPGFIRGFRDLEPVDLVLQNLGLVLFLEPVVHVQDRVEDVRGRLQHVL